MKPKSNTIIEIKKFKIINKLKSIYRLNSVENRKESSAEHTWSTLILADYFLNKLAKNNPKLKINRLKVYELLMYHDLAEIHTGDYPLEPNKKFGNKKKEELASAKKLRKELPNELGDKYFETFMEFENMKTIESKFARAIDVFDAQIHEIDYKKDWKGWTKEFLIEKKGKYFEEFPAMKKEFYEILYFLEDEGYFSQ
jgi:putative hydrolases of HD superfamily